MRIDYISDLHRGRTNWCIHAKVLNSWHVTEFFTKRVLLLVDTKGDTIEVAFVPTILKKLRKYIYEGEWYQIRNFQIINPTLRERNTHHPFQIKFTDDSTMFPLESINSKNYFRFEDLDDIYRGRINHHISFDVCGCIVAVDDRRNHGNGVSEVVLTLLNGRNETVKCRAMDYYANLFMSSWESSGCHLTYQTEPVFCVLRFWRIGEYEGEPCIVNTLASSKIYLKPEFVGLENHKAM
ncbi:PREDICTED: uncharacterized protein LOC104751508 [Camelina sativa]|uniref:Uncharacterized protein LOC104751508 n=1 Tax=Camelina sativa TaxID=90675 RepID=A0ABM0WJ12_CAMSA|nr:PREDICTED: uncharacterized protein LOC104751508 [Camelina sativa]